MHLTTYQVFVSALLFLLLASGSTLAQSASPPAPDSAVLRIENPAVVSTASSPPAAFPLSEKGTWDLSVWAREAIGKSAYGNFGDAFVSMAGFRTGYVVAGPAGRGRLRGTLEYFFDVIPVFVLTKPKVIYGGGFSPVGLQWNFVNSRCHPYLEVNVGGIVSTHDVPPGNTSSLNFTANGSAGAAIFADAQHALTANVGYWHLSNARLGRYNPSLNTLEIEIEYHWLRAK